MADAPERIWLMPALGASSLMDGECAMAVIKDPGDSNWPEYVRADPLADERVRGLVEAAERVIEDFDDMREAFDGLASSGSVTTWGEMDPCGPMDAWMEGERLIRAALAALKGEG